MFKNYLKIAWRNLIRNKVYSLINVIGLSIGIAFTFLIAAYVWGELQVNHQLKNADRQYILQSKWKDPNMGFELTTLAELPKALKTEYPNLVANYYRWDGITSNISKGDKHFRESIQLGDSTLLGMYSFNLLYGDVRTAFNDPFSVVISADVATKYFGKQDVVGQTVNIESFTGSKHDFTISGVLKTPYQNSVTNFNKNNNNDFFLPLAAAKFMGRNEQGWNNNGLVGYIELKPGVTPKNLEKPIQDLLKKNAPAQIVKNLTSYLVPLTTYYISGVKQMLVTLSLIAFFILLMALTNFTNLCISQSSIRMKEIGIRKVLGGMKKQLILQFLIESVILVMFSTFFALVIYMLARPVFSNLIGKEIFSLFSFPAYFYFIPVSFALIIGLLAGFYPSFVLTSLKSVDALKGKLGSIKENILIRKALVVFQFCIAIFVFVGSIIISQQINLFFSKSLGYNKDYVVYASVPRDWSRKGVQKMEQIRYQFEQIPEVKSVSLSWEVPDGMNGGSLQVYKQGLDSTKSVASQAFGADNKYAATFGIPMLAGSFFTSYYQSADSTKVVINESQSKALGWPDPQNAIGQQIRIMGFNVPFTICGVSNDFHFGSMQEKIKPATFINVNYSNFYRYFSFKMQPGNMQKNIKALQQKWSVLLPDAPFEYNFMDEALQRVYQSEMQLEKASYLANILAVIIVLLGILGLVSQSIQKRTKEIGVRKILGSSVTSIIFLFVKEFLGIVLTAGLIACPIAYFIMQKWLNNYAYQITITAYPFLIAVVLLTLITSLLIIIQTAKAALANPVKSLRSE